MIPLFTNLIHAQPSLYIPDGPSLTKINELIKTSCSCDHCSPNILVSRRLSWTVTMMALRCDSFVSFENLSVIDLFASPGPDYQNIYLNCHNILKHSPLKREPIKTNITRHTCACCARNDKMPMICGRLVGHSQNRIMR